jgi:hypothetical protein
MLIAVWRRAKAAVEDARRTINSSLVVAVIALLLSVAALIIGVRIARAG